MLNPWNKIGLQWKRLSQRPGKSPQKLKLIGDKETKYESQRNGTEYRTERQKEKLNEETNNEKIYLYTFTFAYMYKYQHRSPIEKEWRMEMGKNYQRNNRRDFLRLNMVISVQFELI